MIRNSQYVQNIWNTVDFDRIISACSGRPDDEMTQLRGDMDAVVDMPHELHVHPRVEVMARTLKKFRS